MNAMIRTTTAVTMVSGGVKANVLPSTATATVNFRVHPADRAGDVVAHVREAVDDPDIEIQVIGSREASDVSSSSSEAFEALRATLGELHPGISVTPALVVGGTDSKHYARIAGDAYRFNPIRFEGEDMRRVHGIDERIAVDVYAKVPTFYEALLRRAAGPKAN
jgi:carboxypeptidase PM20D1